MSVIPNPYWSYDAEIQAQYAANAQRANTQYQATQWPERPPYELPDPVAAELALLGLSRPLTRKAIHAAYRKAAKKAHPDNGGSTERMQELNAAKVRLLIEAEA